MLVGGNSWNTDTYAVTQEGEILMIAIFSYN